METSFKDIYPNATKLTGDFIKNNCAFNINQIAPSEQERIYEKYYRDICSIINETHYMRMSPSMIERFLESPYAKVSCCHAKGLFTYVTEPDERKYLFLQAQAEQLNFDITNGRTSMLRGEDRTWTVAHDSLAILDQLGFCQATPTIKWGRYRL